MRPSDPARGRPADGHKKRKRDADVEADVDEEPSDDDYDDAGTPP